MQQSNSAIKALSILFFALLMGQLIFAVLGYYINVSGTMIIPDLAENGKVIAIGVAAIALVLVTLSTTLYKKKIAAIKEGAQTVSEKLNAYRAANIIRWAMLEAPVLLSIVAFMLTGNKNLLILIAGILILFITTRPSAARVASELSIAEEDVNF